MLEAVRCQLGKEVWVGQRHVSAAILSTDLTLVGSGKGSRNGCFFHGRRLDALELLGGRRFAEVKDAGANGALVKGSRASDGSEAGFSSCTNIRRLGGRWCSARLGILFLLAA